MLDTAQRSRVSPIWWVVLVGLFLVVQVLTTPSYVGDTPRHANDIVEHSLGHPAQFWEFGHLLWRPWGYLGLKAFGGFF